MITYILTSIDPYLLADDSDQADATLGQIALRLPGSIQNNAHLIGHGVAIELADDVAESLEVSTIGFLLRAAHEERQAESILSSQVAPLF
jgi:hypothetical protein